MTDKPAESLEGLILENGWEVIERITPKRNATGGKFSVGYIVRNPQLNNKEGFLKAIDFSTALHSTDTMKALNEMSSDYLLERDILANCKQSSIRRIAIPIDSGKVKVPNFPFFINEVSYLIFERALYDIRIQQNELATIDISLILSSIHQAAVGLKQLHYNGIAHQDIKPSNVLFYDDDIGIKIADLGRASSRNKPSSNDEYQAAGDTGYIPPELFYGFRMTEEFYRRFAADIYHLGSLFYFYFSNISALQALNSKLNGIVDMAYANSDFLQDLPYLKDAFYKTLEDLRKNIINLADEKTTTEIIQLVKELCNPDPRERGELGQSYKSSMKYQLERYITRLNVLAKRTRFK